MTQPNPRRRLTPEELAVSKERASAKRRFRRRWASDATIEELCGEFGMDEPALMAYAASLGIVGRDPPGCYLPTREEILLACAKFRAGWSETERQSRLGGRSPV
jgi:hypothetical protein